MDVQQVSSNYVMVLLGQSICIVFPNRRSLIVDPTVESVEFASGDEITRVYSDQGIESSYSIKIGKTNVHFGIYLGKQYIVLDDDVRVFVPLKVDDRMKLFNRINAEYMIVDRVISRVDLAKSIDYLLELV